MLVAVDWPALCHRLLDGYPDPRSLTIKNHPCKPIKAITMGPQLMPVLNWRPSAMPENHDTAVSEGLESNQSMTPR